MVGSVSEIPGVKGADYETGDYFYHDVTDADGERVGILS